MNAFNPIGTAPAAGLTVGPCGYYTQCVGFGPYTDGNLPPVSGSTIKRASSLIVASDGMYMGRQSVTRLGEQNRRVGYRHPGNPVTANFNGGSMTFDKTISNTVFADGHAAPIFNNDYPHANVPAENLDRCSILRDP